MHTLGRLLMARTLTTMDRADIDAVYRQAVAVLADALDQRDARLITAAASALRALGREHDRETDDRDDPIADVITLTRVQDA